MARISHSLTPYLMNYLCPFSTIWLSRFVGSPLSLEQGFSNTNEPIGSLRYIKSVLVSGVNSKILILMSLIPTLFISPYDVLNTFTLPEYSPSLPKMLRVKKKPTPQV